MLSKNKLQKSDWHFIALISILAIVITSTPLIVALFYSQTNNLVISGLHSLTPGDTNVYFSYINQIKDGSWLLNNQFNFTPQSIGILNIFWLFVGLSAKIFNLSAFATFQLWRIFLIPALIYALFKLSSLFITDKLWQKIAVVFLTFSSGFGIYFNFLYQDINDVYMRPLDLWMPEITIFNTIFHTPHFIAATILIIFSFYFFLQALAQKKYLYSITAGSLALILFNFHPNHFPLIYCSALAYCIYLLFEKRAKLLFLLYHFSLLFLISFPSIIYHFYTLSDPIVAARGLQNVTLSSPFIFIVIGLGFPFIGALLCFYKIFKKNTPLHIFLIIWFTTSLILSFLPEWQFGRRSLHSISIPTILLFIIWLKPIYNLHKTKITKILEYGFIPMILFILIFAPTSLYQITRDVNLYIKPHQFFYLSSKKEAVLEQLNVLPKLNFITSDVNSNFIAGHTNKNVFWGHDHESLDSANKKRIQTELFSGNLPDKQVYSILDSLQFNYIWWDHFDQNIYPNFDPNKISFLQPIITNNEISIYQFIPLD